MLCTYFYNSTIQVSGADSETRIQDKNFFEWEADLHAKYPSMIRKLMSVWPQLKPTKGHADPRKGWTSWEANILSALKAGEDGVDEKEEIERRRATFMAEYRRKLAVKRGDLEVLTNSEIAARQMMRNKRTADRADAATFDPATYTIEGVKFDAFMQLLDRHKLRFTQFSVPHPCKLCEDGPIGISGE